MKQYETDIAQISRDVLALRQEVNNLAGGIADILNRLDTIIAQNSAAVHVDGDAIARVHAMFNVGSPDCHGKT